jgi:hypothetical protein
MALRSALPPSVHDAGLQRGGREHRAQRLADALEPVGDADQDVGHTACLQVVEDLHPELRTLGVLDPQAQDVARAVGQHAQRQVDRLVAHDGVLADLHALVDDNYLGRSFGPSPSNPGYYDLC